MNRFKEGIANHARAVTETMSPVHVPSLQDHEWYWFAQHKPTEVSMLKCQDSLTDGCVSRRPLHTACIDPTAPDDAPCHRNVVVRSCVFF